MSLTYSTYVDQLANLMVIPTTEEKFLIFLPGCIDYAEQRIYRELDFLNTRAVSTTGSFTANARNFSLPASFIVVEQMNAIASNGNRTPLIPVTKEFLDTVYPSTVGSTTAPAYFAPITSSTFLIGPAPDTTYTAEIIGVQRPTTLSSGNTTTIITDYVPDMFIAASMVFAFGYQRDFGAMSDDPKSAASWEAQYQSLAASAMQEQLRARHEGAAWTPMEQAQVQPPRV